MLKLFVPVFVGLFSMSTAAQQPPVPPRAAPAPRSPQAPATPAQPQVPAAPAPPMPIRIDDSAGGQPVNIRLDVSVSEQSPTVNVKPKTMMVILADRAFGQTRGAFEDRAIYVDGRPTIIDGRIRVNLTIQSRPVVETKQDTTLHWQNSFALLLESGKPTLAFETSDPTTNRKLSIEVKATILK